MVAFTIILEFLSPRSIVTLFPKFPVFPATLIRSLRNFSCWNKTKWEWGPAHQVQWYELGKKTLSHTHKLETENELGKGTLIIIISEDQKMLWFREENPNQIGIRIPLVSSPSSSSESPEPSSIACLIWAVQSRQSWRVDLRREGCSQSHSER